MSAEQKRAITAVVISGLILFGWQYFFAPPIVENSDANPKISKTIDNNQSNNSSNNLPNGQTSSINNSDSNVANVNSPKTEIFVLKNEFVSYTISSDLVVIDVTTSRTDKTFSKLFKLQTNNKVLFNFDGNFKRLNFSFSKNSETNYSITNSNNDLAGTILVDDKGYLALNLNSTKPFNYRFELLTEKEELEGGKYSQFMFASDDLETIKVGDDDKGDKDILWFGMDFHYHLFAIVHETKPLVFETTESGKFLLQDIKSVNSFSYKYIFVKKEYDRLLDLGNKLELSVDFSFWSILAVPILRGLQFFHGLIPNWGIAIIILTILMRMLTFPLQYKSFKSMKKMQEIQPELTKLREKYKSDPQKMQTETMALFKKAGTNPLGGCLPMILQMPIFFAFYRVLFSAVELVEAPFFFWITDLSLKDPYYVLPVLMAVAMFFHQRLTPTTTMDPTQKKIMMFMPLIFAVFMKDFPAGLTLYIVVSTFVAMLQQIFVYKRT